MSRTVTRTPAEEAEAFHAAIAEGRIVRAACVCTGWWLVPMQLGSPCGHCGEPMKEERRRRSDHE